MSTVLVDRTDHVPLPDDVNFLVFDTETTGTGARDTVVQLAWIMFNEAGEQLCAYNRLWRLPPKQRISRGAFGRGATDFRTG